MSLPKAVQAQVDLSNQHFAPENENPGDTALDDGQNPPEGEATEPRQDDTATQSAGPDDPPKDAEPDKDALYWQHRFKVIEGKYNAEVPALRQEVTDLKRQLTDKDTRIAELEQQAPSSNTGDLSDEQLKQFREDFGEDLVDFVERMIAKKAAPSDTSDVSELRSEVEQIKQEKLDHAKAEFWTALQRAVPTFREINAEQGFLRYLAEVDPQSGKQRQQLLDEAQQSLDAKGVIDIFTNYQNQAAGQGEASRSRIPEEDLAPSRSRSTDVPPAGGKEVWTGAKINQFYRDKREGRLTEDQAQRLEADIFAAQMEGRVQR